MENNTIQNKLNKAFADFGGKTAIEYGDIKISYRELMEKSTCIFSSLKKCIVQKGMHIGILTNNTFHLIASIIGTLKMGAVFIPLDPLYPIQRIMNMIEISDCGVLLTDETIPQGMKFQIQENFPYIKIISLESTALQADQEDASDMVYTPEDKIYIYFTSGTTGKPRAILGKNIGLVHFLDWEIKTFPMEKEMRGSQLTSPCHDPFLRDVFVPLLSGGTICIPKEKKQIMTSVGLLNYLEKMNINFIHSTPSLFYGLCNNSLNSGNLRQVEYILLAGEKVLPSRLARWYQIFGSRIKLVNLYGPTETTLAKLFYQISPSDVNRNRIPIGKPIEGCRAIIVDSNLKICNKGEAGEIILRTPYMSFGYYNEEALTKEKFIANPFLQDQKDIVYRTGDYGRILLDGNIEFLGRKDRQIKMRGYRIELDEIERELSQYSGIDIAIVKAIEGNDKKSVNPISCNKCGLTSSYPGVSINKKGICSVCEFYEIHKSHTKEYFKNLDDLKMIFETEQGNGERKYDCLLLFSGGKDSTFVLYKLIEMGVKVLAYTFDNGYISNTALENIKKVVEELDVDLVIDQYEKMNTIFLNGLKEEYSVCNGCFKVLRTRSTKLAYDLQIKYIVTGFSRGQIFDLRLSDIYKQNIFDVREVEKKIFEQRVIYHSKKDYVNSTIGDGININEDMLKQVHLVDFYRYSDVTKNEILDFLKSKNSYWEIPEDTGFCSSNCLINDVGIFIQRKARGYDNYTYPDSWEVRTGHVTLEDLYKGKESVIDTVKIERILSELGYEEENCNNQEAYICAYYTSNHSVNVDELRDYLSERLPDYMIPSYFMQIDEILLTSSGKVDYKMLPDPRKMKLENYISPRDEFEMRVEKIWKDILDVDKVDIRADFTKLGGNSINIMTLISMIYQEFGVEMPLAEVFYKPTIEGVAQYIRENGESTYQSIPNAPLQEYYPISKSQEIIFTLSQLKGQKGVGMTYNLPMAVRIEGKIDVDRFEEALHRLIERHESLRTCFKTVHGNLVQVIKQQSADEKIHYYNIEDMVTDMDTITTDLIEEFDLEKMPLFRISLVTLRPDDYLLFFDIHHIISDGTSANIIVRDFLKIYNDEKMDDLKVQYKDFIEWFRTEYKNAAYHFMEEYWLNKFRDPAPEIKLPWDYQRRWMQSFEGDSIFYQMDSVLVNSMNQLADSNNLTLFMVLVAALNVLLHKYSGQEDITIGAPIVSRPHPDMQDVVGMFVNIVALRNKPKKEMTFMDFLYEVREEVLGTYENQVYPFGLLVEKLGMKRQIGRNPIFDVMLILQNTENIPLEIEGLTITPIRNIRKKSSEFDITIEIEEFDGEMSVRLEYGTKLFKRETMELFYNNFIKVIKMVTNHPLITIDDINIDNE